MFLTELWRIRVKSHFSKRQFRETMPIVCSIVGFPLRVCIKARLVGSYVFNRVMMDSCQKSLIQSIGFLKPCKHCSVPNMSRSKLIRKCVWTRDFSISHEIRHNSPKNIWIDQTGFNTNPKGEIDYGEHDLHGFVKSTFWKSMYPWGYMYPGGYMAFQKIDFAKPCQSCSP